MTDPYLALQLAQFHSRLDRATQPEGSAWCEQVPDLLSDLGTRWQLRPVRGEVWAGFGGIARAVTRVDGQPAVLKVSFTTASRDLENEILTHWNGISAARVLERDDALHARLLQRLGEPLTDVGDPAAAMSVAGALAKQLAIQPPPGLPRMTDIAAQVATRMEGTAVEHTAVTRRDLKAAVATYRELGADQPDTLLHGDLQGKNILRSADGEGWAVIDPLGLVGEVAIEALTPLRDRWATLRAADTPRTALLSQLEAFAEAAEAPLERVLAWTHARSVRAVTAGVTDDQGLHAWLITQLRSTTDW